MAALIPVRRTLLIPPFLNFDNPEVQHILFHANTQPDAACVLLEAHYPELAYFCGILTGLITQMEQSQSHLDAL